MKAPRHWNVQKSFGNYLGDRERAAPQNSGDGGAEDAAASGISAVGDGETGTRMRRQVEGARIETVQTGRACCPKWKRGHFGSTNPAERACSDDRCAAHTSSSPQQR